MRIKVTAADIAQGVRCDGCSCPIARAVSRACARTDYIVVIDESELRINQRIYWLPREASVFVRRFDIGQPVEPFAFELEDPS